MICGAIHPIRVDGSLVHIYLSQYAREGHSTTQALIYLLHAIHEAVYTGNCCARILSTYFSKGFDIIDHNILLQELCFLNVDQSLYVWIRAFLTNRTQAMRVRQNVFVQHFVTLN